jgi:hydroxyethylthiazole kinase
VTANDCANVLLACGASPIMADDPEEVTQITALSQGLCINLGTLNQRKVQAMLLAGKQANDLGIPVVLDPVGVGASGFRTQTVLRLLNQVCFSVIRGNISEIRALALGSGTTQGVDADRLDQVTESNLEEVVDFTKSFAGETGAVIAITGATDIVTDGFRTFCIRNGDPMMGCVTGTGCQLSALTAAFVAAAPTQPLEATAAAVCAMGLSGELASGRLTALDGNGTYRNYILDAVYNLTPEQLEEGARYEVR